MLAGYLPLSGRAILAGARYRYYPLEGRAMLANHQMVRISAFPCHQPGALPTGATDRLFGVAWLTADGAVGREEGADRPAGFDDICRGRRGR